MSSRAGSLPHSPSPASPVPREVRGSHMGFCLLATHVEPQGKHCVYVLDVIVCHHSCLSFFLKGALSDVSMSC